MYGRNKSETGFAINPVAMSKSVLLVSWRPVDIFPHRSEERNGNLFHYPGGGGVLNRYLGESTQWEFFRGTGCPWQQAGSSVTLFKTRWRKYCYPVQEKVPDCWPCSRLEHALFKAKTKTSLWHAPHRGCTESLAIIMWLRERMEDLWEIPLFSKENVKCIPSENVSQV